MTAGAQSQSAPDTRQRRVDLRHARALYEQGLAAERARDWQAAFELYAVAADADPRNTDYLFRRELLRARLSDQHRERAENEILAGRYDAARRELEAALALDPESALARERLEQLPPAPSQQPGRRPALQQGVPHPSDDRPPRLQGEPGKRSFDMRGDVRDVYEKVAIAFGLWAVFDPELRARQVRLRLEEVDWETALDVLAQQTITFWRAVDTRTILVAENTETKWREYAPTITRSILLAGSATPEQMQEALRAVREVVGIGRAQLDTRSRTITMRDTPEAVDLAAALLEELEQPVGEFLLDVDILEVDRRRARQLGITPPTSGQVFSVSPQDIEDAQRATTVEELLAILQRILGRLSAFGGFSAQQLAGLASSGQASLLPPLVAFGGGRTVFFSILPGAAAEFAETFSVVRSARRVILRAQDGRPATFFVGERVPFQLSRLESPVRLPEGVDTGFQFVRPQFPMFTFEEIGLRVQATPRMHPAGEVTLQLKIEIKGLLPQSVNDIPILTSRTLEQTVRLRENETAILAGILREEDQLGGSGWPGVTRVPGPGQAASRRDRQRGESELLLVLTPRRLRLQPRIGQTLFAGRAPVTAGVAPAAAPSPTPAPAPERPERPQPQEEPPVQPPPQEQTPPVRPPRPPQP